jgi:peptidoglycan/xylan/chitin deacetylase (PgdA/CDA1 family)
MSARRIVLLIALSGVLALFLARAARHIRRPATTISVSADSQPRLPGVRLSSPIPGTYRLHERTEDDLQSREEDITIVEKSDHSFEIQEEDAGDPRSEVDEVGTWQQDGDTTVVELTQAIGSKAGIHETLTLDIKDGFPVVAAYAGGHTLHDIQGAAFDLGTGDRHPLVMELHRRLARIPYLNFEDPGSDLFTEETRKAIVAFQQAEGLYPNGEVDAKTWMLLGNPPPPVPIPEPSRAPNARLGKAGTPRLIAPKQTADGKPIVYLTFDDGPAEPYSQEMLDLLARYHAQGTFFVVGKQVLEYPDLVRAEVRGGHHVANHSTHHKDLSKLDAAQFTDEVETTRMLLLGTAGDLFTVDPDARYLRPPYGATSANVRQFSAELGYLVTLWDIDPMDWRRPGAKVIAEDIVRSAFPGSIVLLHDGGGERSQSVAALEMVLRELRARGFVFRAIYQSRPNR